MEIKTFKNSVHVYTRVRLAQIADQIEKQVSLSECHPIYSEGKIVVKPLKRVDMDQFSKEVYAAANGHS